MGKWQTNLFIKSNKKKTKKAPSKCEGEHPRRLMLQVPSNKTPERSEDMTSPILKFRKQKYRNRKPKTTLEKRRVRTLRTWSCSLSSLFLYAQEVSPTSRASKQWDQRSDFLRGNGKALFN